MVNVEKGIRSKLLSFSVNFGKLSVIVTVILPPIFGIFLFSSFGFLYPSS